MKLQCLVMLKEGREQDERSGNINKIHNNEFYNVILDEDLGCIEDMSNKYGSNFVIKMQDGAPGKVFWKVNAIMQPFFNNYL